MKSLFGNRKSVLTILGILIFILGINVLGYALPVSQRTPQVQDAIVAAVPGVNSANNVTKAHLAAITKLDLSRLDMPALKSGDFDGLTALTTLNLQGNDFSTLPAGVFDGLTALTELSLNSNKLVTLPGGVFDGLTQLKKLRLFSNDLTTLPGKIFEDLTSAETIWLDNNELNLLPADTFDGLTSIKTIFLSDNQLTSLPNGIFDDLTSLKTIFLGNNQLTSLPDGIFDNLTALSQLRLNNNGLTFVPSGIFENLTELNELWLADNKLRSLPDGIFEGLNRLRSLSLGGNAVNPMPISVSLEKVADGQFKAVVPTGAPFDIVLPLRVSFGSITGNITSVRVPTGSVESNLLTVTQTPGERFAATVNIRRLPRIPTSNNSGYSLMRSGDLPLKVTEGDIPAPAFIMTVGTIDAYERFGFEPAQKPFTSMGSLFPQTFNLNGITYTVTALYYDSRPDPRKKNLLFETSPLLPRGFELRLDSQQFDSAACRYQPSFDNKGFNVWRNVDLNWSKGQIVRGYIIKTTPIPPGPPINLQATSHFKDVTLTWEPPVNADPTLLPVDEYELRISDDGGTTWGTDWDDINESRSGQKNRSSVTISRYGSRYTFSNGTAYTFEVRAKGGDGPGDAARVTLIMDGITSMSERTPQVRDAIVAAVPGVNSAADVTEAHLAAITRLSLSWNVSREKITWLKVGDFSGLTSLEVLWLSHNSLTSLPEGIFNGLLSLEVIDLLENNINSIPSNMFKGLTSLKRLDLQGNRLTSLSTEWFDDLSSLETLSFDGNSLTELPTNIFDRLTSLKSLDLGSNSLTSLSADVFERLSTLTHLDLRNASLTSLPIDIFDGLSLLSNLDLGYNKLSNLPIGIFDGLSSLTQLQLSGNAVSPMPINISLKKVADRQFKAVVPTGAPFDIMLPVSVTNGSMSGGATSITISKGSVESGILTVTRTSGAIVDVTVNIGTLPGIPTSHQGYALRKSTTDLPLTVIPAVANNAPVFTDGTNTTRSIAENTAPGEHIGTAITATDADNDTLTYTLGGTDAAAFEIDATTGQLKTKAALDYETKTTYTVTITASDGSLTDTITVTINITDVNELPASTGVCKVGDVLKPGQSCTYPGTDAVFSVLGDGTAQWHIPNLPTWLEWINQTVVSGSLRVSTTVNGQAYHFVAEQVGTSWEIKEIGDDSSDPQPEPPIVTEKPIESDYDHIEGPWLWMIAPGGDIDMDNLSEASEGVITEPQIAQNGVNEGDHFDTLQWTSGRLLPTTVCGIFLCSSDNVINVVKEIGLTDREQLSYYSAYALINISSPRDQNDVLMGVGSDDSIKVWLNGSVVYKNDVSRRTTGIQNRFPVNLNAGNNLLLIKVCNHGALWANNDWGMFFKIYLDTQDYTVSLPMGDGNSWQPVTVVDDPTNTAPVFTDGTSTTRTIAENTASRQHIGTAITATDADNDTLTYRLTGTDASSFSIDSTTGQLKTRAALDYETKNAYTVTITVSDGSLTDAITVNINVTDINEKVEDDTNPQPDTPEQPGNTGDTPTLTLSTAAPLTEGTLHGGVVTLTLSNGTYESSNWRIRGAVSVSGIAGLTFDTFSVDRVSDTQATVELEFDGNMTANGTFTISVGAGAIKDYDGAALTRQISVPPVTESITASTAAPLTEATLDESVVTLTLSGRKFERWNSAIRPAVSVSGIVGVTVRSFDIDRESDTEVTVELTFNGNMNTDGTLTFTVGADAIAGYNGPALTAQTTITADRENILLANFPNPFNPETWIPYQLAKPTEVTITIYAGNGQVVRTLVLGHQPAGFYYSRSRAAYWDGRNAFGEPVASGVYFYTLTAGDFTATRKMLIRK